MFADTCGNNGSCEAEIRQIKHEELSQILQLYKHLHPEDLELKKDQLLTALWDEIINDPNMHYLVANINGEIVSSCVLVIIKNLTRNARPFGVIENVVTHSDFRKKGLGKAVLSKALDIAWQRSCYKVMLLTGSKEEATLNFYEGVGFKRGEKTGFIVKPPI